MSMSMSKSKSKSKSKITEIKHYHLKPNKNIVEIGSLTLFFSYRDCVAFHISGYPVKYIKVSTTSTKHVGEFINDYLNIKNGEVVEDHNEFTTLLNTAILGEINHE